ncbi:hypothetical protein CF392_13250 [Tamilnaduibacter salinus]|uniref:Uncharacterized protein n=1 Tax=Tamilnaduibacter salinus TaxID=1484056 RepID=A0A2A2I1V8_9GAMM|nr:hypothetical protein [Tamilnaduibacter salinus]PAV24983.1 hypothetical protein CF392_13250 [Tamilnaduibacter salinus]
MTDLEIYIRDLDPTALETWLAGHLDALSVTSVGTKGVLKGQGGIQGERVTISVYPNAVGKRYACLILEGGKLPWETDLDCARSAWEHLQTEIRCSPGDWKEGDPVQDEKWWRLDERGEQLAIWN